MDCFRKTRVFKTSNKKNQVWMKLTKKDVQCPKGKDPKTDKV